MTVTAKTVYTEENLLDFQWYNIKSKKVFWSIMLLYNIAIIAILIASIINDFIDKVFIISACCIFALDIVTIFLYIVVPRFTVKKAKSIGTTIEYTFNETEFSFTASNTISSDSSQTNYEILAKIVKNGKYLYLFINRINALIVDTTNLNCEELDFIKNSISNTIGHKRVKWK